MQNKTVIKCQYITTRMTKLKKANNTKYVKYRETATLIVSGTVKSYYFGKQLQFLIR